VVVGLLLLQGVGEEKERGRVVMLLVVVVVSV
jgi:hypothetical protein